ncbi:MAG: hypothetical protein H6815_08240 [Phycisphaeraceae bacterium]|nr:hypothetical protein [Phycisphaerales bacterium]MCB9860429.1 hypothetical protein [Phycisphaeraceae bacterium]
MTDQPNPIPDTVQPSLARSVWLRAKAAFTWTTSHTRRCSTWTLRATDRLGWSLLDPGWPFVIAAIGLLGATVLIPAFDRLDEAMWERDRASAYEQNRLDRIELHTAYLDAIERGEPGLVRSLAAEQLNRIPAGESPLLPTSNTLFLPASVFRDLEPGLITIEPRQIKNSLLERWTTNDHIRPWLILAGGVMLLIGLLPMQRREESRAL